MDSGLYNNLPFVKFQNDYLIFSPFRREVIRVTENQFKDRELDNYLDQKGFYRNEYLESVDIIKIIGFIVTTDCNLRCKYCYASAGSNPQYMTDRTALKILEFLKNTYGNVQCLLVSFFGGEPTLNMSVIKLIVENLNSFGLEVHFHITTNGLINDRDLDFIIINNFDVSISLDGTPKINDLTRIGGNGKSVSKLTEKSIKKLLENNKLVQIRNTITELNLFELEYFVKYCSDLGVKYIHFEPLSIDGYAKKNDFNLPATESFITNFMKVLDTATKYNVFIISSFYMNLLTPSDYFCTSLNGNKLLFNPDGSISLCYKVQSKNDSFNDFIIGEFNSIHNEPFIDQQKKEKLKKLAQINLDYCDNCIAKNICAGGCPHRNYNSTGMFNKPDPWLCEIKKEITKDAIKRLYTDSINGRESIILGTHFYEEKIVENLTNGE